MSKAIARLRHRLKFLERIPVRVRLSLGHAVWMAIVFVAIGVGVYRVVEDSVLGSLDAALITSARSIRDAHLTRAESLSALKDSPFWESILDEFFGGNRVSIRSYAQMVDMSGKVHAKTRNVRASLPVTPQAVGRAEKGLETLETFHWQGFPPLRQITLPVFRRGRFTGELIQVGTPLEGSYQALGSVRRMLWITLPIALVISVLFGYLLTSWSFRPVIRVTKTAASLGVNDLGYRLSLPPANDELRTLTISINEMLDRLEDAFTRLRRFPGDVSHELRTPLAVLRGEAELALRRERTPEQYRQSLKTIAHESQHMSTIVEDLLLLARATGKKLDMKWEDVDTQHFIAELTQSVEAKFREKNLHLDVQLNTCPILRVSPGYLSLALKNILLNACKHSAPDQKVVLKVTSLDEGTRFEIQDFGEGIPKESIPYIFDPFYRADTARNRNSGGVGIGLSLVQALIKLHNGRISVDSEVGVGTTFTAMIPVRFHKDEQPVISGKPKGLMRWEPKKADCHA